MRDVARIEPLLISKLGEKAPNNVKQVREARYGIMAGVSTCEPGP
jgi:hypothetical protein